VSHIAHTVVEMIGDRCCWTHGQYDDRQQLKAILFESGSFYTTDQFELGSRSPTLALPDSFYCFLDWSSRHPCLVCPSALQAVCCWQLAAAENDVSSWTCSFVCPTRLPWTCIIIWDTLFTAKSSTTTLVTSMKTHLVNTMCIGETHCSLTEVYHR